MKKILTFLVAVALSSQSVLASSLDKGRVQLTLIQSPANANEECQQILSQDIGRNTAAYEKNLREVIAVERKIHSIYRNLDLTISAEEFFPVLMAANRFSLESILLMDWESDWRRITGGYRPVQSTFTAGFRVTARVLLSLIEIAKQQRVSNLGEHHLQLADSVLIKNTLSNFLRALHRYNQMGQRKIFVGKYLQLEFNEKLRGRIENLLSSDGISLTDDLQMEAMNYPDLEGLRIRGLDGRLLGMMVNGSFDPVVAKRARVFMNWLRGPISFQDEIEKLARECHVELKLDMNAHLIGRTVEIRVKGFRSRLEKFRDRMREEFGDDMKVL